MPIRRGRSAREIREDIEEKWFALHEKEMIAAVRQKRAAAQVKRKSAEAEARRKLHWKRCPRCGSGMRTQTMEGVEVEECTSCEGVFLGREALEGVLMSHDRRRRSFFRRLLGLEPK